MSGIVRFGVSVEGRLLREFDRVAARKGYTNRSEALRDLIRDVLVERQWEEDQATVGTITLVYDHHVRTLKDRLTAIQHDAQALIVSGLHVHLDHDHCLEVLVVRGRSGELRRIADRLIGAKGVKHGKLTMTTTGKGLG